MTDARSRVNGGGRHACGRAGRSCAYMFIWNGTTAVSSNPLSVETVLKAGLVTSFRTFSIECEYANDRVMIVYSNGAVANAQFVLVVTEGRLRFHREKPLTTII